jgi:hypothetical protein
MRFTNVASHRQNRSKRRREILGLLQFSEVPVGVAVSVDIAKSSSLQLDIGIYQYFAFAGMTHRTPPRGSTTSPV